MATNVDGLILRGGKPLMWQFDGGYVDLDANGSLTGWNYYITDHLGSTRMVVGSDNSIKETINYYPFGSEMRMEAPAQMSSEFLQPYRFTGKELDRVNGLNMYDFGARWYDVAGVPMWTSVDPLAEKYYHISPYAYCGGNPVMLVDPDGMLCSPIYNKEGKFLGTDDDGLAGNPIVMNDNSFKQGMSHFEAERNSLAFDEMSDEAFENMSNHFSNLPNRPDYDGYLTLKEANEWYVNGKGQPLFTDLSKIDLSSDKKKVEENREEDNKEKENREEENIEKEKKEEDEEKENSEEENKEKEKKEEDEEREQKNKIIIINSFIVIMIKWNYTYNIKNINN